VPSNNAIDSAGQQVAEKIVEKSRAVSHPMKSSIYFSTLLNKIPEEVGWKKNIWPNDCNLHWQLTQRDAAQFNTCMSVGRPVFVLGLSI